MVIDMIIGCVGENDLIVNDICEFFDIEFVDEFLLLICIVFIIVFDVFGFIFQFDIIVYSWMDIDGMELGMDLMFEVIILGQYQFMVINMINGCLMVDMFIVSEDMNLLVVQLEVFEDFICIIENVLLSVVLIGDVNDFIIVWSVDNGGIIVFNDGILIVNVDVLGIYQLMLIFNMNGCDFIVIFEVVVDIIVLEGEIVMFDFLGCFG